MVIHSKIKLFTCSICNNEFYRKDTLKLHMLTHSDKKLFKCIIQKFLSVLHVTMNIEDCESNM
ncbi:hypothetical protein Anas_14509 [Armadillidium nasatum]|uniref:C2H2-type domain-containing protein n=1 Tax=Armadillidium nasatum TaxID=96803 RepID=A0A5N5T229_9CRUS|nr:hypothetical protein Anas_14509 [Armadillidium nasatum]